MFKRKLLAIDLGTTNVHVWVAGEGLLVNEPAVVALASDNGRVVAIGEDAKSMLGRTPEALVASRPLKDGVIADYRLTEAMLSYFIGKAIGKLQILKPDVMICVPSGATQVERRAALDATLGGGAAHAFLIDAPLASAIGAGIPVSAPSGNMVLHIGGGTAEAAVISLGGVVVNKSVRVGGATIDNAIAENLKRKHNLIIGEQTAEDIKIQIGSAMKTTKEGRMEVSGRDVIFGLPKTVSIHGSEVIDAMHQPLMQIIDTVRAVLENTPPELASDIIDKGIVITGGSSQLRNFDRLLTEETGVPAHTAEDPALCVIRGAGIVMENIDLWKRSIIGRS